MTNSFLRNPVVQRGTLGLLVYLCFAFTVPNFATTGNAYAILESCALIGLIAAGLGATMLAGELDLSVGSVAACAGIAAISMSQYGAVVAVVAAMVPAILFGMLQGFAIARLQIASLVFTLGTYIGIRGFAYIMTNERTITLSLSDLSISMALRARYFIFSTFSLLMIAVIILLALILRYTRIGRELYAIGGARKESRAAGVPQTRPLVFAFAVSAGLAAMAGALASLRGGSATPTGYETLLLASVAAALIGGVSVYGGRGTMAGVFVGVVTLQLLLAALQLLGAPNWAANITTGAVLLAFLAVDIANGDSPVGIAMQRLAVRWRARSGAGRPART
ncbi:ABC transporter permease [Mesorhizobium sp. DCY119]|uniref:ABC transporter permease n=1 Tax=Mesorhizobium sp. DCY119 TaxID=2108445 RepID=UPI000E6CC1BE|nr:ABC transporter permease [Mesorhizobium sp. DCY119]RJG46153.1 ABC transporter permease [Mesorhizobium sp. DCY119]